jgi:hypothetical protein
MIGRAGAEMSQDFPMAKRSLRVGELHNALERALFGALAAAATTDLRIDLLNRAHSAAFWFNHWVAEQIDRAFPIFSGASAEAFNASKGWSGRWESNPRHTAWEAVVLPLNYARASRDSPNLYRIFPRSEQDASIDLRNVRATHTPAAILRPHFRIAIASVSA